MTRGIQLIALLLALLGSMTAAQPIRAQASQAAGPGILTNISTRGTVGQGDEVMIVGFIVEDGPIEVVVRVVGPDLASRGVFGVLADPTLTLYQGQTALAANDNWVDLPERAAVETIGLAPADPLEAALIVTLEPGAYTGIVSGVGGRTGVALVEVFQVGGSGVLANISTRGKVEQGDEVMIGGFIVGQEPTTVVVRAIGPDLDGRGVPGSLPDPTLRLYSGPDVVSVSDNWVNSPDRELLQEIGLAPAVPSESAIVATLQPGPYTAIVSGMAGRTGVGLVEVFRRPTLSDAATLPPDPEEGVACTNYLPNGSFERGGSDWLAFLEVAGAIRQVDAAEIVKNSSWSAHSGQWYARFGGRNDASHGLFSKYIVETRQPDHRRPGDLIGASLRFDMKMSTSESLEGDYDGMGIMLFSDDEGSDAREQIAFFTNIDASTVGSSWRRYEYDITRFAVQRGGWMSGMIFTMLAVTDFSLTTTWYVDDMALDVCYRDTAGRVFGETVPIEPAGDLKDVPAELEAISSWVTSELDVGGKQE